MLIDTHAHLYWEDYKEDFNEVVQRAIDNGITTVINIGVDIEKSLQAVNFANNLFFERSEKIPTSMQFFATVGIHPHEAWRYADNPKKLEEEIQQLEKLAMENPGKVVAIGEAGLDYFFETNQDFSPTSLSREQQKELQRKLFQAQIDLAKKLNLPIVIHCRDDRSQNPENIEAWNECLEMIKDYHGILHCYNGTATVTKKALETDFLISFAGNITYKKNEYLRDAAKSIPLDRIVLETDCPFLSPQSSRGKRNEPANVKEIAECIAEVKGISLEAVAKQTTENAKRMFQI